MYCYFIHEYEHTYFGYFLFGLVFTSSLNFEKKNNSTAKLSTVFDRNCFKLNRFVFEWQYADPKVQNYVLDILLTFRTYTLIISADVLKMYRCIMMHLYYRYLEQIISREKIHQLNSDSYGTCAAFDLASFIKT